MTRTPCVLIKMGNLSRKPRLKRHLTRAILLHRAPHNWRPPQLLHFWSFINRNQVSTRRSKGNVKSFSSEAGGRRHPPPEAPAPRVYLPPSQAAGWERSDPSDRWINQARRLLNCGSMSVDVGPSLNRRLAFTSISAWSDTRHCRDWWTRLSRWGSSVTLSTVGVGY